MFNQVLAALLEEGKNGKLMTTRVFKAVKEEENGVKKEMSQIRAFLLLNSVDQSKEWIEMVAESMSDFLCDQPSFI